MLESIIDLDKEIFLFFNGLGNETWDWFWVLLSSKFSMIPLYLFIVFLLYKQFGLKFWQPFIMTLIVVTLCDRISVELFKEVFERLRPSHNIDFNETIRLLEGKGGKFSFVSSHATNVFGMSMWFFLLLRNKIPQIKWLFPWAFLVSFSRIMVGKHYLLDIICGAILGILIGKFCHYIWTKLQNKIL